MTDDPKQHSTSQNSHPFLDPMLKAMGAVSWEADQASLRYLQISRALPELAGYEPEEWLDNQALLTDHVFPDDRAKVRDACRALTPQQPAVRFEYRLVGADDRLVWVQDIVIVDAAIGDTPRLHGLRLDITPRKHAELLHDFARIVGSSLDHREIATKSLQQLNQVLVFDTASIFLARREEQADFLAVIGFEDGELVATEAHRLLSDSQVLLGMAEDLQPVISPDVNYLDGWVWVPGATSVRSFLGVPLTSRDTMIGALMLDSHQIDFFRKSDLQLVETLAQHIAASVENASLFQAAQRQLAEKTALLEASTALSSSLDLETVLSQIADQLGRAVDATSTYITGWDPETADAVVLAEYYGPDASSLERQTDLGETYPSEIDFDYSFLRVPEPVPMVEHVDEPLGEAERLHMEKFGAKSVLNVPLLVKGNVVGYAELWESRRKREFTPEEMAMCQGIAQYAAIALVNARLYDETRQRAREMSVLHQVSLATAAVVDLDELLEHTTAAISETIYPDMFGFVLRDEFSDMLIVHPSYRGLPPELYETKLPLDGSIVGQVIQTGQAYNVPDVEQEPLYYDSRRYARSEIAVPLKVHGNIIGAINVESFQANAFSDDDLHFLTTLAGQVAGAVERSRLYSALQDRAADLAEQVAERTKELQAERDRTVTILESAGESIVLTDADFKILYANPEMVRQSGYRLEELFETSPTLGENDKTHPRVYDELRVAVDKGTGWSGELVHQRKDGTFYDVAMTITPIQDAAGGIDGYVCVQSDISRLKELERLKTQFVSNVSHELRTPLTNIKMYMTLLERGREEKRSHYLRVLNDEAVRLERLIQDLLDLSRLDTKPPSDWSAATVVNEALHEALQACLARAGEKKIALQRATDIDDARAKIERSHLDQLLTNLLGNAISYTPAGGEVKLSAGRSDLGDAPMIWLSVTDSGPGIPADELPHVFERFYRGQSAAELNVPGTGLGLAICHEIAQRYGGRIEAESEPGQGTVFTVWLQAVDE